MRHKRRDQGLIKPAERKIFEYEVESLDMEGRGIARRDEKVAFIAGALPYETVRAEITRSKPNYDVAQTVEVLKPSAARVQANCAYFGVCGGCAMQPVHPRSQVAIKQRVLEDNLERIGKVTPQTILRPIMGPTWHYRYRARLTARYVGKKESVLVGFF